MNTKKIIAGITIIGMIWAVPAVSLAGDRYDRSDRGQARMERHQGNRGDHGGRGDRWDGRHNGYDRHGRHHTDWRDSHRGEHHRPPAYSHHNAYRNYDRNRVRISQPRVRVVVTPFGIFPVFY